MTVRRAPRRKRAPGSPGRRSGGHKSQQASPRAAQGCEWIYGRQPVRELLRAARRSVKRILLSDSLRDGGETDELFTLAHRAGIEVERANSGAFAQIFGEAHHQGVAAEASGYPYVTFDGFSGRVEKAGRGALVLFLDHLQDPQNLGSILRTADAAGVTGVVIPSDRAAGVTPAVVRASAGASEHVVVCTVVNLPRAMNSLKQAGLWITGLESLPDAPLHTAADFSGPVGLVVGAEGSGMGRLVRETCDFLVRLPMHGQVGSLNAGVAAAIALYEISRQRDGKDTAHA